MSNPDDTQPSVPEATPPYQPLYPPLPPRPADPPVGAVPPPPAPPTPGSVPPVPPTIPPTAPPVGPAATPPPGVPPRAVARHQREARRRSLSALALAAFLTFAAVIGYSIGANNGTSSNDASSSFPSQQQQVPNFPSSGNSNSNGSSSNGQQANIDVQAIAQKVSPSVVNLVSTIDGGEAAGTGIVISSSGLVLTNNHVVARSNDLQAEINGNGQFHPVKVLGYDIQHDVALVQIEDVSGLTPAAVGDSSSVQIGDAVVALGNAGGKGGDPTVVAGSVTATGQQITASDQDGSNAETLQNLIQINANIQPGDSGGPLVDADGKVIGMDAAASSGNGGFGFGGASANEGYAIPIEDALAIAKKIQSDDGNDTIHVGAHAAIIGIDVSDNGSSNGYGDPFGGNGDVGGPASRGATTGNGAYVQGVQPGSSADDVGIQQGDTVVTVDGTTVSSATQLTHLMVKYQPGDKIQVEWVDSSGKSHSASIQLGSGPPA
jgi:S1-C subfamily serine protease